MIGVHSLLVTLSHSRGCQSAHTFGIDPQVTLALRKQKFEYVLKINVFQKSLSSGIRHVNNDLTSSRMYLRADKSTRY